MKQFLYFRPAALLAVILALGYLPVQAQLFSEDFQGGIPATWTLIDNDGATPQPGYAFFTAAWIVLEDTPGDTVAASTSWYSPPATADDWMITPAITLPAAPAQVLRWQAYTYEAPPFADGYEVRVSVTGVAIADFTDVIFTIAAENTSWTNRQVDLSAYAGQTIHIAWRNNSNDKNLLLIDDVEITDGAPFYDVSLADAVFLGGEYDQIPASQAGSPLSFGATVTNTGFDPVTNVDVNVELFDLAGNSLFTDAMGAVVSNLAVGASATFTPTGTYTPSAGAPDIYIAEYTVSIAETDAQTNNDTFYSFVFITDSTYARDVNVLNGFVSLGTASGGGLNTFGQTYDLPAGGIVTSVDAFFNQPVAGDSVSASLYTVDAATGAPQALVTTTPAHVFTAGDVGTFISFPFEVQIPFPANTKFFVGINEYAPGNASLGVSNDIFTPLGAWVKSDSFGGGTWIPNDNFWVGEFSYIIRPVMNYCASLDALAAATQDNGGGNGSAWVVASGGVPPYTYSWSNGGVTDTVLFLSPGTYSVTITDLQGCAISIGDIVVDDNTSIEEELQAGISLLQAFPNPSTGVFTVRLELAKADDLKLAVYDLTGRMIYADQASRTDQYNKEINLGAQPAGVYLLRVQTSNGLAHRRLIVE